MKTLESYVAGKWIAGKGPGTRLVDPSTEEAVAETTTSGIDFQEALSFARTSGPLLRSLSFGQRAEILRKLAGAAQAGREELLALAVTTGGNTRGDAKFDVDGAIGTLNAYADLGATLGDQKVLLDGEAIGLGRSARLFGQHVLVPRDGVAVQINAFNFPAWGLAEKLATALLSGMPVITKPATATALVAHRLTELFVDSQSLPSGALSFVCGSPGDLLTHLTGQDVLAFTGSGDTAAMLRQLRNVASGSVHMNVEADSLNAAVLGPDVASGSDLFNLFVNDIVREMTQKAGQKCTATRRIYVPAVRLDVVRETLSERLADIRVGNPAHEKVTMGPVATAGQLRDVRAGIERLAQGAQLIHGGSAAVEGLGAPPGKGYFVAPTLFVAADPRAGAAVHTHEVFGPVGTLMSYGDRAEQAVTLVRFGGGGLVASVYSDDLGFLSEVVMGIAPYHGRVCVAGEKIAASALPPGMALPQLLHGGPGRAGGGEELGGVRGMQLYLQRLALQGNRATLESLFS
jgi:oxepin-CoA hydrolase/3-oxo-5,6-dehydrosuberyl-CoA semialdehyde dehydrogenase